MKQKVNGFTMVEIVLVMAIAGGIFAGIVIALQGVWADARDSERRDDLLTFIRMLKNYQTNNSRGALPINTGIVRGETIATKRDNPTDEIAANTWAGFYRDYFNNQYTDPNGPYYDLSIRSCPTGTKLDESCGLTMADRYTLNVVTGAVCYGEDAVRSANDRNVAVLYKMEAGGTYCENT